MNKITRDPVNIWMHLANGGRYFPLAPRAEDVEIDVIAHHLATKGRWNGATQHPDHIDRIHMSVAEHSVYVARYVENDLKRPDLALDALLHDASEAFNGDLIRPLKYAPAFADPFKMVEERNERAIAEHFGLAYPMPPEIKIADEAVCAAEWVQIVPKRDPDVMEAYLHNQDRVAKIQIAMLNPFDAKRVFLSEYRRIIACRKTV